MKKTVIGIFVCLAVLSGLTLVNAFLFKSKQMTVEPAPEISIDMQQAAKRLSKAIRLKTISHQDSDHSNTSSFKAFHHMLSEWFPNAHEHLEREIVNELSLLYRWHGIRSDLDPILFLAHMDVVPAADGTLNSWSHPPFEGILNGGFIWGRGSIDDKASLMGMFEAIELFAKEGFRPQRTIYIALGHDEEVGGHEGASKIAELLRSRNVKCEWILDEGGLIMLDSYPGFHRPIALLAVAEKGYVTLELSVQTDGGHSSMPPARSAIGALAGAIAKLERNPFPARYDGVPSNMFSYIGPELPFGMKFLFANDWLFGPLIKHQLIKIPSNNAMLRTTAAPTLFHAGSKENILPQKAHALVNFRLYPGDTLEDVLAHVKQIIGDKAIRVKPTSTGYSNASPVTAANSDQFRNLQKTIHQVFPDAIVAPYLLVAGTDTKHYIGLSENVFRFLPLRVTYEDLKRIHGTNERISVKNYHKMIQFYAQAIHNATLH